MGVSGHSLVMLALGVILMDAGVQASHISNQTRIYALSAEMRNRLNGVYMVIYFLGGATGSALGSRAWERFGWTGVCTVGAALGFAGLVALFALGNAIGPPARHPTHNSQADYLMSPFNPICGKNKPLAALYPP